MIFSLFDRRTKEQKLHESICNLIDDRGFKSNFKNHTWIDSFDEKTKTIYLNHYVTFVNPQSSYYLRAMKRYFKTQNVSLQTSLYYE